MSRTLLPTVWTVWKNELFLFNVRTNTKNPPYESPKCSCPVFIEVNLIGK